MGTFDTITGPVVAAYRKDPRKAAVMGGLGVVMLGLWGRALWAGPTAVAARPLRPIETTVSHATLVPAGDPTVLKWLAGPRTTPTRNLFKLDVEPFAKADPSGGVEDAESSARAGKSGGQPADQIKQTTTDQVRADAAKLHLQSTVVGNRPRSVIDGQLVVEGDAVGSFVVVRIEARRVTVARDGITAVVEMR